LEFGSISGSEDGAFSDAVSVISLSLVMSTLLDSSDGTGDGVFSDAVSVISLSLVMSTLLDLSDDAGAGVVVLVVDSVEVVGIVVVVDSVEVVGIVVVADSVEVVVLGGVDGSKVDVVVVEASVVVVGGSSL